MTYTSNQSDQPVVLRLTENLPATEWYSRIRHFHLPVLLTSGDNLGMAGRYDIITAEPEFFLETRGRQTTVSNSQGVIRTSEENPVLVLKEVFSQSLQASLPQSALEQLPVPFCGGAIGYFAYDLLHPWYAIEPQEHSDIGLPSMQAGIYQWALVIDHEEQSTFFIALPGCSIDLQQQILGALNASAKKEQEHPFSLEQAFRSNFSSEEYAEAFGRVIDYIHAGDCYQVNLAQRFSAPFSGDTFQAFCHLHELANAPYSAYLQQQNGAVLSFSPERFIQVRKLQVITQPIKGTRPRHGDPEQDAALLQELLNSRKDQAENLMIVDLLRNDLGRVCSTGSISVPRLFEAQSFRNVHHMVSTVTGRLDSADQVFDLFAASFPGGSITGAPKIRAMEIINELETRQRSVYCGAIAWFSFSGDMDSNICIRTLVSTDDSIHCWGGGGVVADSVCSQEYQETFDKIGLFIDNLPVRE